MYMKILLLYENIPIIKILNTIFKKKSKIINLNDMY